MAEVQNDLRYAKSHEWVRVEGDLATIGISDYAQSELTDIVYVETPEAGDAFEAGQEFGVVESVKSVSELYSPVTGVVAEINEALEENPELVNESPYDGGWILKVRMDDPSEVKKLLSADDYRKLTEED